MKANENNLSNTIFWNSMGMWLNQPGEVQRGDDERRQNLHNVPIAGCEELEIPLFEDDPKLRL